MDIPQNSPPQGCLVITTDASACGFAFFLGALASPKYLSVGVWTPEQSVHTSNWRELYTLFLALAMFANRFSHLLRGAFILFRSDNTTAVGVIRRLWSRADRLNSVAQSILRLVKELPLAGVAAVHIPGDVNVAADEGSRRAEALYAQRVLAPAAYQWIQRQCKRLGFPMTRLGSILAPPGIRIDQVDHTTKRSAPTIWCPPPHKMEAAIGAAIRGTRHGFNQLLLLPQLTGQTGRGAPPPRPPKGTSDSHRWWPLLRKGRGQALELFPTHLPLLHARICFKVTSDDPFLGNPTLERVSRGKWYLWLLSPSP